MLTVLHIIGDEPHESVRRNIYDEAVFFSRHKADVRFVCREPVSKGTEGLAAALRRLDLPLYPLPQSSAGLPQPGRNSGGSSGDIGGALSFALTLREMCRAFPADVIHSHSGTSFRLACLARFLGAPAVHVYTPHILERRLPGEPRRLAGGGRFWADWCDEFIAVNDRVAAELSRIYACAPKIRRINYGLDVSSSPAGGPDGVSGAQDGVGAWSYRFADREDGKFHGSDAGCMERDHRFTLLLAADSDDHGDGTAVEAFAELVLRLIRGYEDVRGLPDTRYTGLRFIFTSASERRTAYARELSASLDIEDLLEVRAAPRVSDYGAADGAATDLDLFAPSAERADLCVYYSENRFFPYLAAGAVAAGIPALTNDRVFNAELAAGVRELEDGTTASLFEAEFHRPEALARRILELICDGAARAAVAEAGRQAVRARFDIEDMLMGIYDLYVRGLRV